MSSMNLFWNNENNWEVYGNSFSQQGNVITNNGNLRSKQLMAFTTDRNYQLDFDLKFNSVGSSTTFYIGIYRIDDSLNHMSNIYHKSDSRNTTLASDLVSGATTLTLTSASGWPTSNTYQNVGICDNIAWGYKRATKYLPYSSISGNTVTLKSAYSGSTISSGTKVSQFQYGWSEAWLCLVANSITESWIISSSPITSMSTGTWVHYTVIFKGGDALLPTCCFGKLIISANNDVNYTLRNINIQCITDYQECSNNQNINNNTNFKKQGIVLTNSFEQTSMPIRYIRDTTVGSTANASNHYCQIKAFDINGINVAYNKKINGNLTVATDGIVNSSYYDLGYSGTANTGTPKSGILDLQHVFDVQKIIIWHYYPDGRTYYKNKTQVSADGTNWITVYEGEKPQTVEGNIIYLKPDKFSIRNNGRIYSSQIYEY